MDVQSVKDARQAIESLKSLLSTDAFEVLTDKIDTAFSELMSVHRIVSEPLPVDEHGAAVFKSVDDAIERYVDERDALRMKSAAFNAAEKEAKERMSKISMWLRDKGDEFGVDSFKTQHGTAYRSVKTSYRIGDWDSFVNWIDETKNFQCLEKRVAKLATKEIHDASGSIPPGIEYNVEVEFDVRRPTKRASKSDE